MKIEGINWSEAGKYLAINLSSNEILELGLEEVVSKRRRRGGRNPGITTAEVMGKLYREEGEEMENDVEKSIEADKTAKKDEISSMMKPPRLLKHSASFYFSKDCNVSKSIPTCPPTPMKSSCVVGKQNNICQAQGQQLVKLVNSWL